MSGSDTDSEYDSESVSESEPEPEPEPEPDPEPEHELEPAHWTFSEDDELENEFEHEDSPCEGCGASSSCSNCFIANYTQCRYDEFGGECENNAWLCAPQNIGATRPVCYVHYGVVYNDRFGWTWRTATVCEPEESDESDK